VKRFLLVLSLSLIFGCVTALAHDTVEAPLECKQCGMHRPMFAQSRMVIAYTEGEIVGTCSLHCAAADLKQNSARKIKSLQVADCKSRALIDAKSAIWVLGGKKTGVMTDLPKWAFAKKEDADAFIRDNGGKLASFDEALALAEKEEW
jgi:copper chaperone NosL